LDVKASAKELWVRLALAFACFAVLEFLYLRALAGAAVSGHFSMFAHPWMSVPSDLLIFALCTVSLVGLSAFIFSGSRPQRIGAFLLATLPLWVVMHFLWWVLR
jgi:hypothetical protein